MTMIDKPFSRTLLEKLTTEKSTKLHSYHVSFVTIPVVILATNDR